MSAKQGKATRKRLFIGLLLISLGFLFLIVSAVWWLVSQQGIFLNKIILTLLLSLVFIILAVLFVGIGALVWSLWRSKTVPSLQNIMSAATSSLFPIALLLGKWFGLDEDRIKNSYIQVSNQLTKSRIRNQVIDRILILAPHCLQWNECPHKITINVKNCRRCGKCPIPGLVDLSQKHQVELHVVTGGTSARKIVKDKRPQAIVAIACERDLTSGIQDISAIPVIGIVNERPQGPCFNTNVALDKVEKAILMLKEGGYDHVLSHV